jgi:diguanylate cyclase (GGDEF)-like protein/PAS domain S-box-containing protein
VVDDRPVNREFLCALLTYAGHNVHEASDGVQALEAARRTPPDLVISDILMPTMDGVELVKQLTADSDLAHVPVIFYTATYRVEEARDLAASCGVTTVIAKPSEPQVLLDAVHGELGLPAFVGEAPVATSRQEPFVAELLCRTSAEELTALQRQIRTAVDLDESPGGKVRRLKQMSGHLEKSITRSHALSMRLAALVELGVDLGACRDPKQLLNMFCRAARDIMNAKYAAVCVLQETGALQEYVLCGVDERHASRVREQLDPLHGLLGQLLHDDMPRRVNDFTGGQEALGLPSDHPAVDSLLAVTVNSAERTYGWFYVANSVGGNAFHAGDEQLALTLVALLARQYENLLLYDHVKRHAELLEVEVAERKRALEGLEQSEQRFRELAENINEVFFLVDAANGTILYVSPAYEAVWDRSRESLYTQPQSWMDTVHPEDRASVLRHLARSRQSGRASFECRIVLPNDVRWIRTRMFPVSDAVGKLHHIAGVAEDITKSKRQELKIKRLTRIYSVLSRINSAIVRIHERAALLDEVCRIAVKHGGFPAVWIGLVQAGTGRLELVSYSGTDELAADRCARALGEDSIAKRGPAVQVVRSASRAVFHDLGSAAGDSATFRLAVEHDYRSAVALPLVPNRQPVGALVLFSHDRDFFDDQELTLLDELAGDVSFALQYIDKDEQLHHLAYYDSLTGLPNTTLFHERLSQIIQHERTAKAALFLIDLDRFTHLNDTLGRHVGDQLLVSVGQRLVAALPEPGNVARISSDTFALVFSNFEHETDAGAFLHEKIFAALSRPFETGGRELRMSARAGVAVYPADGENTGTLFKNAEAALKETKASGTRYLFYSPALNARIAEDLALEQKLLAAVDEQQFLVHYQPKVDAGTKAITGLEALLRWNTPENGLVSPDRFIPALEDSELILEVGQWVLETALSDYQEWTRRGLEPPPIAVNVSAVQLRYADFADMVLATIERRGVSGAALELEITESVIMTDIESNIDRLRRIADAGVTIAIDDFGTGYSSLRYLAQLPVNALKIDRSFISRMTTDAASMTLVSTIIALAHSFNLSVVAEGVDSDQQAEHLRLMKCNSMQGYLYSKPLPAEQVGELLRRGV